MQWNNVGSWQFHLKSANRHAKSFHAILFMQFYHAHAAHAQTKVQLCTHRPISKCIQYLRLLELKNGRKFCQFSLRYIRQKYCLQYYVSSQLIKHNPNHWFSTASASLRKIFADLQRILNSNETDFFFCWLFLKFSLPLGSQFWNTAMLRNVTLMNKRI